MKLAPACLVLGFAILVTESFAAAQSATGLDGALARDALGWEKSMTPNFRLFFLPNAADETTRELLGERLESALSHNVSLLGVAYEAPPIRAIFVSSRPEMIEIAGGAYGGVALVNDHAVAFVTSGGRAPIRHELMHLISVEAWGMPAEPMAWALEGLGTFAPGTCASYTIRALGSMMLSNGELPSVETIVENFSPSSLHAYLGSASLVEHILVVHGIPAFRVFWSEGFWEGIRQLGVSTDELQEGWHQFLSLAEPAPVSAWDGIRSEGCE